MSDSRLVGEREERLRERVLIELPREEAEAVHRLLQKRIGLMATLLDPLAIYDSACRKVNAALVSSPSTEHEPYADPVDGGWGGYQAACHRCEWRSATIHPPNSKGKDAARREAHEQHASSPSPPDREPEGEIIEKRPYMKDEPVLRWRVIPIGHNEPFLEPAEEGDET